MPEVPRFGWRTLLVSTVLATLAAAIVIVLFRGDGDAGSPDLTIATLQLDPEREVDPDAVVFTEFDGTEVLLSSLHGRPTLVNFFASDCVPCITEMPDLEEVHQELGDQVAFLGLAVTDRKQDALDLVERTGVTYRTAQDDGQVLQLFQGQRMPTTVLLDADGNVVANRPGKIDADQLRQLISDELGISP